MTDERLSDDSLLTAIIQLPRGRAGIVFRHYRTAPAERRALFKRVRAIARRRRLMLLLADSPSQAAAWGADGWHRRGRIKPPCRARPALHSMAVHNLRQLRAAERDGADLLFLSPLFPTRSHPGAPTLGLTRFSALAHATTLPVMALGGVGKDDRLLVKSLGARGWAAIDGLTPRPTDQGMS